MARITLSSFFWEEMGLYFVFTLNSKKLDLTAEDITDKQTKGAYMEKFRISGDRSLVLSLSSSMT